MLKINRKHSFFMLVLLCSLLQITKLCAQDTLKNLPEYSLPLTEDKMVIAHCMTGIIRYNGHPIEDSGNPDYYAPTGNSSAPLGGLTQVKVMADSLMATKSLDEAVAFEMLAAKRSGIDGFQMEAKHISA
ncbi:MAG: hypothetical protein EOO88_16790 [Pedobacter sp.]|nr:MAG: hypothetical protein EOO88_16790 [Pedobacter sp.]